MPLSSLLFTLLVLCFYPTMYNAARISTKKLTHHKEFAYTQSYSLNTSLPLTTFSIRLKSKNRYLISCGGFYQDAADNVSAWTSGSILMALDSLDYSSGPIPNKIRMSIPIESFVKCKITNEITGKEINFFTSEAYPIRDMHLHLNDDSLFVSKGDIVYRWKS